MRFISKLTIAVAAIFFALSVSAHAGGHTTTSNSVGKKVYQVCKKWRVDQGGWMPTEDMQHCRNVLFCAAESNHRGETVGAGCVGTGADAWDVDSDARNVAKACLQDGKCN